MAYRITTCWSDPSRSDPERSSSFEVETADEALRVAAEGAAIARQRGMAVSYEVHGPDGGLVMSYTSGGTLA